MNLYLDTWKKRGAREMSKASALLRELMPPPYDNRFVMLSYIDPYGITIFNAIQCTRLLQEWQEWKRLVLSRSSTEPVRQLLDAVESMIRECSTTMGASLRFEST
jgi:hypothetical protein